MQAPTSWPTASGSGISSIPQRKNCGSQSRWGLADLPWQGRIVELQVRVRRFRCSSLECRRRIFAERLDIARPKARRTVQLHQIKQHIGFALGGEPGSRLAVRLAMPVSGDTLLRLVRASDTAN